MSAMKSSHPHPCLSCGACCAYFRVSFRTEETLKGGPWQVPLPLVEEGSHSWSSMKGTTHKHRPACVALTGTIGKDAHCTIYEKRPSPCRNFMASYEDGIHHPRCDEARRRHGLKPLGREAYGPDHHWPSPNPNPKLQPNEPDVAL